VVDGESRTSLALQAVSSGCGVLVEKPVALTYADAVSISTAASSAGVVAMPAHILRFAEPYMRAKEDISSGRIGTPTRMTFHRYRGMDHDARFPNLHPVLATMIHDIDLALWFSNARSGTVLYAQAIWEPGRNQPSRVCARIRLETEVLCDLDTAWSLRPGENAPDFCSVTGTSDVVTVDLAKLRSSGQNGIDSESTWLTPPNGQGALGAEVREFVNAVRSGVTPKTVTMSDAVNGLALAEQIITSCVEQP